MIKSVDLSPNRFFGRKREKAVPAYSLDFTILLQRFA